MANKEEILKKMRAVQFMENNRTVLEMINILRINYVKLKDVQAALNGKIPENRMLDSVNYLAEAGYIRLRTIGSHETAELADVDYRHLEAKLTKEGIALAGGKLKDEMVI